MPVMRSAAAGALNVRDHGARIDGTTDDTPAIQAALNACGAAGGGRVYIPPGTTILTGLTIPDRVWLDGAGQNTTTLRLRAASNTSVIRNAVSPDGTAANAEWVTVTNLRIDGNGTNQTTTSHGIHFTVNPITTKAPGDFGFDTHQRVANVTIYQARDNGFEATGRSEMHLDNVYADACGNYGIHPSYDSFLATCVAANNGRHGFYFNASSIRLTNCKSWWNGATDAANGSGFCLDNAYGIAMAGCEAQDNRGAGYLLLTAASSNLQGCIADSNSMGNPGVYPGIDMWASHHNILDVACHERQAYGTSNQTSALRIRAGGGNGTANDIRLMHRAVGAATVGAAVTANSDVTASNQITVNAGF